jgi:hypothetical protein
VGEEITVTYAHDDPSIVTTTRDPGGRLATYVLVWLLAACGFAMVVTMGVRAIYAMVRRWAG